MFSFVKAFTGIEYIDDEEDHAIVLEIGSVDINNPKIGKSEEKYQ